MLFFSTAHFPAPSALQFFNHQFPTRFRTTGILAWFGAGELILCVTESARIGECARPFFWFFFPFFTMLYLDKRLGQRGGTVNWGPGEVRSKRTGRRRWCELRGRTT